MTGKALVIAALAAALWACGDEAERARPQPAAESAALTYDGADARNRDGVLAHGERMARMMGCKGCHGDNLLGRNVTAGDPAQGDMWASNVTLALARYTDGELDRLIRHGEPRDGRTFWFMPSETFQYLSDADYAALVAYLRTYKPDGKEMPPIRPGSAFAAAVEAGEIAPAPAMAARFRKETPPDLGPTHALGRYIAMTTCTECHNSRLQGYTDFSPDVVAMVGQYDAPELAQMLRTGEGKVKKDLGLMSITSRNRFARLTDREMTALVGYLKALPPTSQ